MYKLYTRFFIITFFGFCASAFANTETNVIARLNKVAQQPQYDYNIVSQLASVVSTEIYSGKVKLWSSANKELQIFPSTLKDIEKANDMTLAGIDNFFVYEIWKEEKLQVEIQPVGFLFASRNKKNTDFTFGFVSYDDVKDILMKSNVDVGIKSSATLSLDEIIKLVKYNYTLIQYGSQTVVNTTLSEKIKNDVFNKKTILYKKQLINSRIVSFAVERQADETLIKKENANFLLNTLQSYMRNNIEEYLSVGGDVLISHLEPEVTLVLLNKIEIKGVWTKNVTGVDFKPLGLTLFINNTPLQFISIDDVNRWKITPGTLSLEQYIVNKNYEYIITKINNKNIAPELEIQYQNILENGNWDKFEE